MDYENVLGEHKFPTYEELKSGLLRLIDEGKISREDAARVLPALESEKLKFKVGDKVIISNEQKGIITRISAGKARVEMGDTMRIVDLSTIESEKPMNQEGLDKEIGKIWETCEPVDEGMGVETANIHIEQFDYLARHFAQWGAEHLADARKTSPKDLEEAAQESATQYYIDAGYSPFPNVETAAHKSGFIAGAKWQAEQLLKSSPLPEDTVLFNKGVEEGKRLMMEEAMEGEVMTNGFYPYEPRIVAPYPNCPYDFGDKVRVIVLPKED